MTIEPRSSFARFIKPFVDEHHTGHCECPMNSLESRGTIDPAFSQSLNRGIR
jgi:hypothetical protein